MRRLPFLALLSLVAIGLLIAASNNTIPTPRSSVTIWISASGSDGAKGTFTQPMRTATAAARRIGGDGIIMAKPGVYSENVDMRYFTNIIFQAVQPNTNDLGITPSSFVNEGGGLWSFTYSNTQWTNQGGHGSTFRAFIYEMGQRESFIPFADRIDAHHASSYRLRDFIRLTEAANLAAVSGADGLFFTSNSTVFFNPYTAVPTAGTIKLNSLNPANCGLINGTNTTHAVVQGWNTRFGYNGINATGCGYFEAIRCEGNANWVYGYLNSEMMGPVKLTECEFAANWDDGTGHFLALCSTNIPLAEEINCRVYLNGDKGSTAHYGVTVKVTGGEYAYHDLPVFSWNGGIVPFGGARYELDHATVRGNDAGLEILGWGELGCTTWTNHGSMVIAKQCLFDKNRSAVYVSPQATNSTWEWWNCWKRSAAQIAFAQEGTAGVPASGATGRVFTCTFDDNTWVKTPGLSQYYSPGFFGDNKIGAGAITLKTASTINFPSVAAGGSFTNLVALTGAEIGSAVFIGTPTNAQYIAGATNLVFTGEVFAPDVVSVRCVNNGAGAVDPPSGSFTVVVFGFNQ